MQIQFRTLLTLALSIFGLVGCGPPGLAEKNSRPLESHATSEALPDLGPSRLIEPGIQFQEVTIQRRGIPMRVWFYQPEKPNEKLALVLVPPAGSTLFAGMALGEGDRAEHYPYVRAGFAVVSFDIDGHYPDSNNVSDQVIMKAAKEFRDAKAGLANTQIVLDLMLAKVPNIDKDRIYKAGHSSAATLALLAAEHEPRIKACAAYAPCTDVEARLKDLIATLDAVIPGYRKFLQFSSPKTHAEKLNCEASQTR